MNKWADGTLYTLTLQLLRDQVQVWDSLQDIRDDRKKADVCWNFPRHDLPRDVVEDDMVKYKCLNRSWAP